MSGKHGQARSEAHRLGRAAGLLSVGIGAAGILTYLYFAVASHNLSAEEYGRLVVLWSVVFLTISTLFRPIEQLLSRTIAEREAKGERLTGTLGVATRIQLGTSIAFLAVALALRAPIRDGLLDGDATLYWIMVGAVLAFGASFLARGYLAGRRRFGAYAALLLSESAARFAFALALALGMTAGQDAVAAGIVAAPALSLSVVPFALRIIHRSDARDAEGAGGAPERQPDGASGSRGLGEKPERGLTLAHGGGFAAAVLLVMVSEQAFLNAGPLLARAIEGTAAAGLIFNVLMLARAPLVLFQAVATSLLPHLTRLRSQGSRGTEGFRLSIRLTLWAIAGFAGLVAVVVAVAGPDLMQLAFGGEHSYRRGDLLVVTGGMGFYLAAVTLNQAALAQGRARRAAACWVSSALAFVAWSASPILDDVFLRIELGFAGAAMLLGGLLYGLYRSHGPIVGEELQPESAEELEARLAAADEAA